MTAQTTPGGVAIWMERSQRKQDSSQSDLNVFV